MINRFLLVLLPRPVQPTACAILMLMLSVGAVSTLHAQDPGSAGMQGADSVAVLQTVEQFQEALVQGDSLTVAGLLLSEAVILESGGTETKTEYLSHHFHSDGAFLRAMTREPQSQQLYLAGDAAWVASTSRLHGTYNDRQLDLNSAELMTLRRMPEGWRVAAIHWSSRARN